ncbi:MAG: hypothetical protein IKD54_07935 [Clostridia bacterium]|nr:hypothetical protein [Clostridia bacterium]
MSKVITAETFKEWMLINKPSILLLQSYHHSKEKIACKCKICGNGAVKKVPIRNSKTLGKKSRESLLCGIMFV